MASATSSAPCLPGRCNNIVNLVVRSTSVPIADPDAVEPRMRSPSQLPGTALSSTALGRWEILTMFDPPSPFVGPTMRLAQPATGPQMRGQLTFESAASLDVQGLIDRFVRHPHLRSIRVVLAQSVSDLLGTVLELQSCLDLSAQGKVRRELPGSVTSAFPVGIRLADTGQIRGPAGSY